MKTNFSKIFTIIISLIEFIIIVLSNVQTCKFDYILGIIGLHNLAIIIVYWSDLKYNFYNEKSYHNHYNYIAFPIKHSNLVKKEFLYLISRIDIIVLNTIVVWMCYHFYFNSKGYFTFILFVFLFVIQFIFFIELLSLIKNYSLKKETIIKNIQNCYIYITTIVVITSSTTTKNLPELLYFSPFPGNFFLPINENIAYHFWYISIPLILILSIYILLKHRTNQWL